MLSNTDDEQNGLAVPRGSVVRSANGQDVVYEHVTAERFQAHLVRIQPLDGERVLIATGIGPGRRVVTQGAELRVRGSSRCSDFWLPIRCAIAC